jgi:predicted component of type VI protein secretion system
VDDPWYYSNDDLHRDLKIPTIRQEIQRFAERHERRLHNHVNSEVLQLLNNTNLNRKLKMIKLFELCSA